MLTVACYLWSDETHSGHQYDVEDVLRLKASVAENLSIPYEFVCITDDPGQLEGTGIRARALAMLPNCGRMFASPKLMTFHPDAASLIGGRILAIDLDVVITGNIDAIASRDEPLVLWRNPSRQPWAAPSRRALYNSSLVLVKAGARGDIWERAAAGEARQFHGDQDWVSALLGPDCPYWDENDGVYRLGRPDTPGSGVGETLPENARIVFFPGDEGKPWLRSVRARAPWLETYWPEVSEMPEAVA